MADRSTLIEIHDEYMMFLKSQIPMFVQTIQTCYDLKNTTQLSKTMTELSGLIDSNFAIILSKHLEKGTEPITTGRRIRDVDTTMTKKVHQIVYNPDKNTKHEPKKPAHSTERTSTSSTRTLSTRQKLEKICKKRGIVYDDGMTDRRLYSHIKSHSGPFNMTKLSNELDNIQ